MLLDRIVDELLQSGVADLSLRPLAAEVETSARMLIYHFGTKEQLVAEALGEVRLRIGRSLRARASERRPGSMGDVVTMVWDWATEPANHGYFRLLFEVDGLTMFDGLHLSGEVRRAGSRVWIDLIGEASGALAEGDDEFTARATLVVGAFTGLLQEFLSTGDRARTTEALSHLVELLARTEPTPVPVPERPSRRPPSTTE
ncbi:TetR family transcriptional regulator [soil metagenome]